MHYIIDGYNLLFSKLRAGKDFAEQREELIAALNKRAEKLHLNVTVVFDAHCRAGDLVRSHFKALELIYTAQGELADQYIIRFAHHSTTPQRLLIVSSDKKLCSRCRIEGAQTQNLDQFISTVNRQYKKPQKEKTNKLPNRPLIKNKPKTIEDGYEKIFQQRYDLMEKHKSSGTSIIIKPKEEIDPLLEGKEKEKKKEQKKHLSDHERWLEAFSNPPREED